MIEMKVKTIALDSETKNPVMILTDIDEKRFLPIWIGSFEAAAIMDEMEGNNRTRPMTHDLMKTLLDHLNGTVRRVIVNDLQDQTYFARMVVECGGKETEFDARPSDSVALAVRFKAPIFVTEQVIQKAAIPDKGKLDEDSKKFKEFIEHVSADMFVVAGRPDASAPAPVEDELRRRVQGGDQAQPGTPPAAKKDEAPKDRRPPKED